MAVDWLAIRNDYINGGGSYRKMAEKYSVPLRTIAHRAKEEKWQELKEAHCNSIATKDRRENIRCTVGGSSCKIQNPGKTDTNGRELDRQPGGQCG